MQFIPDPPKRFLPGMVGGLSFIWEDLLPLATQRTYKKGTFFYVNEESPNSFGYIRSGRLSTFHQSIHGDSRLIFILGTGSLFCETYACTGFVNNFPLNLCLSDTTICYFPSKLFKDDTFLRTHTKYVYNALYSIATKHNLRDILSDIVARKTVTEKNASWIYMGCKVFNSNEFSPTISQQELALLLGTHKSSLNRSIGTLKEMGAINSFLKTKVSILDRDKLLNIANGNL